MEQNLPTCGQLERNLSQSIQKLYLKELEHCPDKVICQLFGNRLAIVVENSLTAVELALAGFPELEGLVKRLNKEINKVIQCKLKTLIEEILSLQVEDILFDSTIETNRAGAIATLSQSPQVRNPTSIPKNKSVNHNKQSAPVIIVCSQDKQRERDREELEVG